MNNKSTFQLGATSLSKMAYPRKHASAVDSGLKQNMSFLVNLQSELNSIELSGLSGVKEFEELKEIVRFSDPVSTPETASVERTIEGEVAALVKFHRTPSAETTSALVKLKTLINFRNQLCKSSKANK